MLIARKKVLPQRYTVTVSIVHEVYQDPRIYTGGLWCYIVALSTNCTNT